jgi:N-methylhydantoinase A
LSASSRICSFDGACDVTTRIVDRASMQDAVSGPAIIEDAWSTVVIPPGWQAKPDAIGNLFLTKVVS